MPRRPFRIGRSLTGLGLFATRPIRKHTRIAEYKGRKVNTKEANKLENVIGRSNCKCGRCRRRRAKRARERRALDKRRAARLSRKRKR